MDDSFDQGISIPAGGDRFQEQRKVFGSRATDTEDSTLDTKGGLSVIEITDERKGGPPQHLHHEHEGWFYVIDSECIIEIGDGRYKLGRGDSVLAPRKVPHVWAHVAERIGKLLIAFQPAGKMEVFFSELAQVKGIPPREELQRLFSAHGMQMTGPPLSIE